MTEGRGRPSAGRARRSVTTVMRGTISVARAITTPATKARGSLRSASRSGSARPLTGSLSGPVAGASAGTAPLGNRRGSAGAGGNVLNADAPGGPRGWAGRIRPRVWPVKARVRGTESSMWGQRNGLPLPKTQLKRHAILASSARFNRNGTGGHGSGIPMPEGAARQLRPPIGDPRGDGAVPHRCHSVPSARAGGG